VLTMGEHAKLTMAELEAAWERLTAPQEERAQRDLMAALEINARTYATKPPHAATYGTRYL